ncbi:UNVERIFIED_CONTAM: hypothetical protein FKN15_067603, partial [Acipenser sinensis]
QEEEWRAVGRILVKGYSDHSYFPLHSVNPNILHGSFLSYISQTERDLVDAAIEGILTEDNTDDLLDFLDRMGCTTIPTKENMKQVFLQIAHKELIQKPKYALDKMSEVSRVIMGLLRVFPRQPRSGENVHREDANCKKVLKLL